MIRNEISACNFNPLHFFVLFRISAVPFRFSIQHPYQKPATLFPFDWSAAKKRGASSIDRTISPRRICLPEFRASSRTTYSVDVESWNRRGRRRRSTIGDIRLRIRFEGDRDANCVRFVALLPLAWQFLMPTFSSYRATMNSKRLEK